MKRSTLHALCLAATLAACDDKDKVTTDPPPLVKIPAYLASDVDCSQHSAEAACAGDTAHACAWIGIGEACPAGARCPSGVCLRRDPCREKTTAESCAGTDGCAWSAIDLLCPLGSNCAAGGFCHTKDGDGSGCACVSPLACPMDGDCPQMECDCSGGGGGSGGGSCTCACAACEPGATCPPCACDCRPGGPGDGCVEKGTCACACPVCPPGAACAPCECGCTAAGTVVSGGSASSGGGSEPVEGNSGGSAPAPMPGASTCLCPVCPPDAACAPCSCEKTPVANPCEKHVDSSACAADTANHCSWVEFACMALTCPAVGTCIQQAVDPCAAHLEPTLCSNDTANACVWYALGMPCRMGETCRSGVCQKKPDSPPPGGGDGCACACPAIACLAGTECIPTPCSCSCGDPGSCVPPPPPGSTEPVAPPQSGQPDAPPPGN